MESRAYLAGATLQPKAHSFCRSFTKAFKASIFQGKLGWFFFKVNLTTFPLVTFLHMYEIV